MSDEANNLNWRILPDAVLLRVGPPNTTEGPAVLLEHNQAVACFCEIVLAVCGVQPTKERVVELVTVATEMRPKPEPGDPFAEPDPVAN